MFTIVVRTQGKCLSKNMAILINKVAQQIGQLTRNDTDTSTREHITHPVTVVKNTHDPCGGSRTITHYWVPGRTGKTILFVQDGSTHKSRCRMSWWPWVSCCTIRAHLTGCILDTIDKACHKTIRHGCRYKHTLPVGTALHSSCFQTEGHGRWEELEINIDMSLKTGDQTSVCRWVFIVLPECFLLSLSNDASCEKRNTNPWHITKRLIVQLRVG